MSYIEHPCIMEHIETGRPVLFFGKGVGVRLIDNQFHADWEDSQFKNITREYLTNTWGVVESEEHAEFIKKLAKANGISLFCSEGVLSGGKVRFFECENGPLTLWHDGDAEKHLKQITIPMPPKCGVKSGVEKESPELDWPQVGDEVVLFSIGFTLYNNLVKITYIGDGVGCYVDLSNKTEYTFAISDTVFKKPKTPEQELRDELISAMDNSNTAFIYADEMAKYLLSRYTITPK